MDLYKLILEFSIDDLLNYIDDDPSTILLIQYIKDTKVTRLHSLSNLNKVFGAYYRALENMINYSYRND